MAKTIVELLNNEDYDTCITGIYTRLWMSDGVFYVYSKKTLGGSYTVNEYKGKDEAEAVKAFEKSESRR
jgi:hypothetical protein